MVFSFQKHCLFLLKNYDLFYILLKKLDIFFSNKKKKEKEISLTYSLMNN